MSYFTQMAGLAYHNFVSAAVGIALAIALSAQKALPAIDLGALRAPHGLEMVNGKVYFTAEGSKVIGRYDPSMRRVLTTLSTSPTPERRFQGRWAWLWPAT